MDSNVLAPERRSQLADIVQKMEANKETEEDIRLVVGHFKDKYSIQSQDSVTPVSGVASITNILNPEVNVPQAGGINNTVRRVWDATKETFIPTMDSAKRFFNPNAGMAGLGRLAEEEGRRVGQVVRASGDNLAEKIATSPIANVSPTLAAGLGTAVGTFTDVTSDSLTPSSAQRQLGVDALSFVAPKIAGAASEKMANVFEKTSEASGRRGLGFIKSELNKLRRSGGVERANAVASEMIKQKVVTPLATPAQMLERANNLDGKMGNKIGEIISKLDKSNLPTSIDALSLSDEVGRQLDMVAGKGSTAAQKSAIKEITDRILENAKPDNSIGFLDAQGLKEIFQKNGNWSSASDAFKADAYRRASGIVNAQLRKAVGVAGRELGGAEGKQLLNDYLEANLVKGKTKDAIHALTQLSNQKAGNKFIDQLSTAGAVGGTVASMATGHGVEGAIASATLLLSKKFADQYGAQLSAVGFKNLSNLLRLGKFPQTSLLSSLAARTFVGMLNKKLTKDETKK